MKARITNNINGASVICTARTDHPTSSYGCAVWVDDDNNAYMQVGTEHPLYTIEIIEEPIAREFIGAAIKDAMAERNITIRQLAAKTGYNPSNICRIINGKYSVGVDTLKNILDALDKEIIIIDKVQSHSSTE